MKKILVWLERPKIIIPGAVLIALVIGALSYNLIGKAPSVVISPDTSNTSFISEATSDSIDLAFLKTGRLATVSVSVGDIVKKGEVLATLDAGDALGVLNQTKGALELAKAQYASLNVQYSNAKKQQDVLVANAYRTLLSSSLIATARNENDKNQIAPDNSGIPQISGTYTCAKEGEYEVDPYPSGTMSGFSFSFKGIESGWGDATHYNPQPLGSCGLFIQFPVGYSSTDLKWIINIPNTTSSSYATNKNAYDLAVATRDQVLKQFEANLGENGSSDANVAQATIDSAEGAYEVALASYQNSQIVAPEDGTVSFVDSHLKVGQSVAANKVLITIVKK